MYYFLAFVLTVNLTYSILYWCERERKSGREKRYGDAMFPSRLRNATVVKSSVKYFVVKRTRNVTIYAG